MPPLKKYDRKIQIELPARKAVLGGTADVLVVGGGPSGLAAAISAARTGAKVILAERYGFFGGMATACLVSPWMSYHKQKKPEFDPKINLFPRDHGPGEPVIKGILKEFVDRLVAKGGAIKPTQQTGYVVPVDPEAMKIVAMDMLDEAGVEYLFHCLASGVTGNPAEGVIFETKSSAVVIKAGVIVDCSGDGDIAAMAGADFEMGRRTDGLVQPMTLMFRMVGVDEEKFREYARKNPEQWKGVHGLWELIDKASVNGDLDLPREDILMFAAAHEGEVVINSTRVTNVFGTDVWDLTYAEHQSHYQMQMVSEFLKKYIPGFENAYTIQSGMSVAVRETRRIVGEYQITVNDILEAEKFEDAVARGCYPVDIHNPKGKGTKLRHVPAGQSYDIPLRALIPKSADNLVLGGRCISGTHKAHSSYRVIPISIATGQAAGVCAALAVKNGQQPRNVPASIVQEVLIEQGVDLG